MKLPITHTLLGTRRRMGVALDDLACHSGIPYAYLADTLSDMPLIYDVHFTHEKKSNRVILSLEASQALLILVSADYKMAWDSWHAISDIINGVTP